MKILLIISLAFVATQALSVNRQWSSFKADHKKSYDSDVEENLRFGIFQSNLKKIQEHNEKYEKGESSYYMGVTQFADMTPEEFKHMLDNQIKGMPEMRSKPANISSIKLPESVDWTETGAVLGVKDQGTCGSCWAFSTTGAIEGQNFIKNNISIELSEQELIDCSILYGNLGCTGGSPMDSFDYIRRLGISSEESYPYLGVDGKCNRNPNNTVLKINDSVYLQEATVAILKSAVASVGPISVLVTADTALQLYEGGIFDEENCQNFEPNHAVLAVGYGSENGTEYWLLKNSWGKLWGEDGYYRLQVHPVICAILSFPMYPLLF